MWAILGGGISGLSAATYLSRAFPRQRLAVLNAPYPQGAQWGGWIGTVERQGHFFELGPRTLRPSRAQGAVTLDLIHSLGLQSEIHPISKTSKAAKNRYIYSQGQLQTLPSSLLGMLFQSPLVMRGVIGRILKEPFIPSGQPSKSSEIADESIHSFLSRRLGSQTVDHLVSAIIHGIYAGDTKQLSARSTLTSLYRMEAQYGSIVKGLIALLFEKSVDPFPSIASSPESLKFIQSIQKDNAIYSFKKGMSTIVNGLVKDLGSNPNVTLLNETCSALDFPSNPSQSIKVGSATGKVFEVDRVVSTIPARSLSPLLSDKHPDMALQLSSIPDISVAVVNLLYDESVKLPVNGFGYLIPRSETSASILGVIFDSDSLSSPLPNDSRVRLTVMMGGHSFEKLFGNPDAVELSTLLQTALDSIKEHLGISAQPIDTNVAIHKNAIPQYTIGHTKTLNEIHSILQTDERLRQRLSILGASYTGVGMNDCIFATRQLARNMQRSPQKSWSGLEGVL